MRPKEELSAHDDGDDEQILALPTRNCKKGRLKQRGQSISS
jgi:hypothetical protein